ncbi:MAG: glycosyltransferase family 4 protein [Allosphingosinicella sp.]|uniref:glycosyltransferase family 4 protein n=1 Tax=Allosphingosinicella sp. TaxID=2823234 RepID=UPI003925B8D4
MRIAHILPALTKGGAERVAVELANHFAEGGDSVTILAGWPADRVLLTDRISPNVSLRYIAKAKRFRSAHYLAALRWVDREWEWLRQQDVIHCHLTFGAVVGTIIREKRLRAKEVRPAVVETYHGVGMAVPRASRWLAARLASRRDGLAVMAVDDFWGRFLASHRSNARLILNGVSFPRPVTTAESMRFRRDIGLPAHAPVVGTIGVLRADRRMDRYIPAFAEIARRTGPETHFFIGGDGPEMPRIRRAAAAAGIADRLHLPGVVHDPALALSAITLYLTTNVGAVTGIAALEAVATGLPVIALQFRPNYEVRDQDWIWSTLSPVSLGREAAALLSDPEARQQLAIRQMQYLREHHSVEDMSNAYRHFYQAAIAVTAGG